MRETMKFAIEKFERKGGTDYYVRGPHTLAQFPSERQALDYIESGLAASTARTKAKIIDEQEASRVRRDREIEHAKHIAYGE